MSYFNPSNHARVWDPNRNVHIEPRQKVDWEPSTQAKQKLIQVERANFEPHSVQQTPVRVTSQIALNIDPPIETPVMLPQPEHQSDNNSSEEDSQQASTPKKLTLSKRK